jgi:Ku protein
MPRAIWSGTISFGLVAVPVKAYPATRDRAVRFNQLEKGTGARIRYKKVSEKTNREVDPQNIQSGYQLSRGNYVVVEDEELQRLRPKTTRSIDVNDFVDLASVDPVYYERTYWLAPDGEGAVRAYRLLRAAMEDRQKVGIGSVVMRNKQYLAAIRPLDGALAMSTMHFADGPVRRRGAQPPEWQGRGQRAEAGHPDCRHPLHAVGPDRLPRHLHRRVEGHHRPEVEGPRGRGRGGGGRTGRGGRPDGRSAEEPGGEQGPQVAR